MSSPHSKLIDSENFLKLFLDKTRQFTVSLEKFHALVNIDGCSAENSVAAKLSMSRHNERVLGAIGEEIPCGLHPVFSDEIPSAKYRYHPFSIWVLGATKGLKIRNNCEIFPEDDFGINYSDGETTDTLELADRVTIRMSDVLILLLRRFPLTNIISNCIEAVARDINRGQGALDDFSACEMGEKCEMCEDNVSDAKSECLSYEEFNRYRREVKLSVQALLNELVETTFYRERTDLLTVGMAPYLPHFTLPAILGDCRSIGVVRTPEDEKAEKERLAKNAAEFKALRDAEEIAELEQQVAYAKALQEEAEENLIRKKKLPLADANAPTKKKQRAGK